MNLCNLCTANLVLIFYIFNPCVCNVKKNKFMNKDVTILNSISIDNNSSFVGKLQIYNLLCPIKREVKIVLVHDSTVFWCRRQ